MKFPYLHDWPNTVSEAKDCQLKLKDQVIYENQITKVNLVAGVDVGFENQGAVTRAAVAILSFPDLELQENAVIRVKTTFPYIPGYLSFREAPAVITALEKIKRLPDLILCDGQGIAHPRRFGIACHLGVITGLPTIGVAKSRLIGDYDEPPNEKGKSSPLTHDNEIIGAVLRTRVNVKPLFISIGHKIDLKSALEYVMACTPKYRLPETTRWAHKLASGL